MRVSTRLSALCAAVLVPASLLAQSQPCASLNDSSNSVSTAITALNFAVGNNTYAWRFVPQQVHVATGLRIYTNNNFKAGFMKLEIWDESGSAPEPGKRLGGGTWRLRAGLDSQVAGSRIRRPDPAAAPDGLLVRLARAGLQHCADRAGCRVDVWLGASLRKLLGQHAGQ
jgi:hypothetical protein